MARWFHPEAFWGHTPKLDVVCRTNQPHRGSIQILSLVVKAAQGHVSGGMKEMAQLGWYRMAAFASMRAACCERPAPLETPLGSVACDIDTPLMGLAHAAANNDPLEQELAAYEKAVTCIVGKGAASVFSQRRVPHPIESKTFIELTARAHR
jgi:hypothetical protein